MVTCTAVRGIAASGASLSGPWSAEDPGGTTGKIGEDERTTARAREKSEGEVAGAGAPGGEANGDELDVGVRCGGRTGDDSSDSEASSGGWACPGDPGDPEEDGQALPGVDVVDVVRLLNDESESGAYCSPLRLLAWEVAEGLNADPEGRGLTCNLVTGQERKVVAGARHPCGG